MRQIVNKLFQNAKKEKKGKGFKHAEKICAILYTGNTETNGWPGGCPFCFGGGERLEEKEVFRKLMKKQMPDGPTRELLAELRLRPTYGNGILLQMVKKAAEGDLNAAKYVLGAVEEEPQGEAGGDLRELSTEELRKMLKEG